MGATERRKGATYERQIAAYLRTLGAHSIRTQPLGGRQTLGDLTNPWGLHLELKNHQRLDLAGWIDQATRDATADRTPVVIIKRRGTTDPARSYAVLELHHLIHLIASTPTVAPAPRPDR
jgi:hypothetical protein